MLRYLSEVDDFRCLSGDLFKTAGVQVAFGKHTHIFGRNGSGKSTISEFMRLTGMGKSPATAKWRLLAGTQSVRAGQGIDGPNFMVFNRWYVEENLAGFADGSGSSEPLFKVGKEAVENKKEREKLGSRIDESRSRWQNLNGQAKKAIKDTEQLLDEARAAVTGSLLNADPNRYNQTKYNKLVVRKKFEGPTLTLISDTAELVETLALATSADVDTLDPLPFLEVAVASHRSRVSSLLRTHIEVDVIDELAADPPLAHWVEQGVKFHEHADACKFCGNILDPKLLARLAQHFSDSLNELRDALIAAKRAIEEDQSALKNLLTTFPKIEQVHPSVRERWTAESEMLQARTASAIRDLDTLIEHVALRIEDPLNDRVLVPLGPDWEVSSAEANESLAIHNRAQERQASIRSNATSKYENHILAGFVKEYQNLSAQATRKAALASRISTLGNGLNARLRNLELVSKDSSIVATELNQDLQVHFGHSHLNIVLGPDGDGYIIMRDSLPAANLSEGEKNAITLSYFLRSLNSPDVDPDTTIVVIDDPVTSLDRDVMFATHALLRSTVDKFAQTIILTHDYEYLRLCIHSMNSRWNASQKKIKDGDAQERSFPKIQFLEISSVSPSPGERASRLSQLPANLVRHPSEYHYLFSRVLEASAQPSDGDLPLLANAARRLLEGFLAFKAPHVGDTQGKLTAVARASDCEPELEGRVLRFANALSHRDEPSILSSLEFVSAEQELAAVLRFIETCDKSHYDAMVKSVT